MSVRQVLEGGEMSDIRITTERVPSIFGEFADLVRQREREAVLHLVASGWSVAAALAWRDRTREFAAAAARRDVFGMLSPEQREDLPESWKVER